MRKIRRGTVIAAFLTVYDVIAVNAAYFFALWFRFDCAVSKIPEQYLMNWAHFIPVYSVVCLVVFWVFKLYRSIWRFASYTELIHVAMSSLVTCEAHVILMLLLFGRMPVSYFCVGALIQAMLIVGIRFSYRFVNLLRAQKKQGESIKNVMLIGAGNAGQMILRDIQNNPSIHEQVNCLIDDDRGKWRRFIDDVPIVGGRGSILDNVQKYGIEKIYLAIPSATPQQRKDILEICKETDCELKNLPGMYQFVLGDISVSKMKPVSVVCGRFARPRASTN